MLPGLDVSATVILFFTAHIAVVAAFVVGCKRKSPSPSATMTATPERPMESRKDNFLYSGSKKESDATTKESENEQPKSHIESIATTSAKLSTDVVVEPREIQWTKAKGERKVKVINGCDIRFAVKMKCSDNFVYRIYPFYAFLEPRQDIVVSVKRGVETVKYDKMVLMLLRVGADVKDAAAAFKKAAEMPQEKVVVDFHVE